MICGGPGVSDAYYCKECTIQEKDVSICCGEVACGHDLIIAFLITERRMSEDRKSRKFQDGLVLREEEIRVQAEVV